jgi:hypothetical protein
MCYFNYSFSPVISLVNSFIKGTRYDKLRDANAKRLSVHNFAYCERKPLLLCITFSIYKFFICCMFQGDTFLYQRY